VSDRIDRPGSAPPRGICRWVLRVLAIAAYAGLFAAIWLAPQEDAYVVPLFIAIGLVPGLIAGEWWGLPLSLVWIPAAAISPDPDSGVSGTVALVAFINVPLTTVLLAVGVALRRGFSHLRPAH
jgi:hypothetical protein